MAALKQQKELSKVKYPLRFKTYAEWIESSISMDFKSGISPGGASAQLGVSRQTIYAWVKAGFLDWIDVESGSTVMVSTHSMERVKNVLDQLCEEWGTTNLQGYKVAQELKKRLPQLDMFQDL